MENIDYIFDILSARIDALGGQATSVQSQQLVEWIVRNVPMDYWQAAAEDAIFIPNVYSALTMRLGEFGQ